MPLLLSSVRTCVLSLWFCKQSLFIKHSIRPAPLLFSAVPSPLSLNPHISPGITCYLTGAPSRRAIRGIKLAVSSLQRHVEKWQLGRHGAALLLARVHRRFLTKTFGSWAHVLAKTKQAIRAVRKALARRSRLRSRAHPSVSALQSQGFLIHKSHFWN
jgi:hypothetical protein